MSKIKIILHFTVHEEPFKEQKNEILQEFLTDHTNHRTGEFLGRRASHIQITKLVTSGTKTKFNPENN